MPSDDNPVVTELWRGDGVESVHRGSWVFVDTTGAVVDGRGDPAQLVYARSSSKSMQALPLIESGTADALGLTDSQIAVAISSHTGESIHVDAARSILAAAGLNEGHLQCGPQRPMGGGQNDGPAARIANNCSGKHAGFLATAVALGDDPADYLALDSRLQGQIQAAILEMTGADPADVSTAIDGCSAPTFRLPLSALATGLARVANPEGLSAERAAACRRITAAARARPELVAGTFMPRFDTDILRATDGRVFAKGGAEGVQALGIVGAGVGFVAKIDDGSTRSLHRLAIAVLSRLGYLSDDELESLKSWHDPVRRNRDNVDIGRHKIVEAVLPAS